MLNVPIKNGSSNPSVPAQPPISEQGGASVDECHAMLEIIPEASTAPELLQCPLCQGRLSRIPRRPIDKLISRVSYRQRYRCASYTCGWEGNLRMGKPQRD